jgi:hypothetical protein
MSSVNRGGKFYDNRRATGDSLGMCIQAAFAFLENRVKAVGVLLLTIKQPVVP